MRVSRMLDRLENMQQIELLRDTYGTHIKIVNYDKYQSPITYKKTSSVTDSVTSSVTIPLQQRYDTVTTALLYNKDNKVNKGVIKKKATTPSISQKLKTNIAILEMEAVFEDVKKFVFFQKENNKDEKIICHALSQLIKKCKNGDGKFERWPKKRAWGYCEKIVDAETQIENARESEAKSEQHKKAAAPDERISGLLNSIGKPVDENDNLSREEKIALLRQQAEKMKKG